MFFLVQLHQESISSSLDFTEEYFIVKKYPFYIPILGALVSFQGTTYLSKPFGREFGKHKMTFVWCNPQLGCETLGTSSYRKV